MATISSAKTGNWSAGDTWVGGTKPGSGDTARIVTGHTVTKDDAAASPDCEDLDVQSGAILLVPTGSGISVNDDATSTGTIQIYGGTVTIKDRCAPKINGTAGGTLNLGESPATGPTRLESVIGTEASPFTINLTKASVTSVFDGSNRSGYILELSWVVFTGVSTHALMIRATPKETIEHCDFTELKYIQFAGCNLYDCYFYGLVNGIAGANGNTLYQACVWDEDRDGNVDQNGLYSITNTFVTTGAFYPQNRSRFDNCDFTSTSGGLPIILYGNYYENCGDPFFFSGLNKEAGKWLLHTQGWSLRNSTTAKKVGTQGLLLRCHTDAKKRIENYPAQVWMPIPCTAGETINPNFWIKNVNADWNFTGRDLLIDLDPGNAWGLASTKTISDISDPYNQWVNVSFTGGTAAGTTEEGTCWVILYICSYVAEAQLYIADFTNNGRMTNFEFSAPGCLQSDSRHLDLESFAYFGRLGPVVGYEGSIRRWNSPQFANGGLT